MPRPANRAAEVSMREHTTRDWVRRRGSHMTNALLYAAFAIIVLIGILLIYEAVMMNANRKGEGRPRRTDERGLRRGDLPVSWAERPDHAKARRGRGCD